MKKNGIRFALASVAMLGMSIAATASAKQCRIVQWTNGSVITVSSALYYGTRIQFPSDLVVMPKAANADLWNVDYAANQALIKPNSNQPQGAGTTVHVFTADGAAYDIVAKRAPEAQADVCVMISRSGSVFDAGDRDSLKSVQTASPDAGPQLANLQAQLGQASQDKQKAVIEALRRFRYHIYTRYQWDGGKGFSAKDLISDVYDDGRFTYVRLSNPNRGLLAVETVVGGKPATVSAKYDDSYAMYTINGIYPEFTLKTDDDKIKIKRADAGGHGAF